MVQGKGGGRSLSHMFNISSCTLVFFNSRLPPLLDSLLLAWWLSPG